MCISVLILNVVVFRRHYSLPRDISEILIYASRFLDFRDFCVARLEVHAAVFLKM